MVSDKQYAALREALHHGTVLFSQDKEDLSKRRLRELGRMAGFTSFQADTDLKLAAEGLERCWSTASQCVGTWSSTSYNAFQRAMNAFRNTLEDDYEDEPNTAYNASKRVASTLGNDESNEQKGRTMARTSSAPAGVFAIKDLISEPLLRGAQTAAADEAGNLLLDMAKRFFGASYPEVFRTAKGQHLAKIAMATAVKTLAHNGVLPMDTINLCKACDLVLEAAARDLVQPAIVELSPALKSLAQLAPGDTDKNAP